MGSESKRRKSRDSAADDSTAQISKKAKTTASSKGVVNIPGDRKVDNNGDPYWNISRLRRVTVSTFNGRTLVNVREYFEKDGQELPGKKGISMSLDQFNALIKLLPDIETAVKEKGDSLTRPEYATEETKEPPTSDNKEESEEEDE
ncbi:hypothetical protein AJ80_04597 [Polytolypa hystricis UAMH7299]|uniref:Transcriptional coactivator p15 (PC4) C-terminal domain-containing protein n=1 Tax=Polytolypa hystricis (strain UAMH7299) TaxID=1447883 RepID=A0A2B7Y8Y8_POLH7|nr:hypothetical protein AJ80_04597 [Polytolypa hystricis UAMH7299]